MDVEPQIELKEAEAEEGDVAPGPSHQATASQPPDEEQAGLKVGLSLKKPISVWKN